MIAKQKKTFPFSLQISFEPIELETYTEEYSLRKNQKFVRPAVKTRRKKKVYRPGIFIEAGVHGREWITPAVATWIIKELIKHNNTEGKKLLIFIHKTSDSIPFCSLINNHK